MAIKWLLESKIETQFALFWPRKLVKQSNKLYIAYTSSSSILTHNGVAWIIQSSSGWSKVDSVAGQIIFFILIRGPHTATSTRTNNKQNIAHFFTVSLPLKPFPFLASIRETSQDAFLSERSVFLKLVISL